jgi:hypothetical protein
MRPMGVDRSRRDALLHPVAIGALVLLLANDHVLKAAWPGWWTGKLSDVAGLIVAPLALVALTHRLPMRRRPGPAVIAIAVGAAFAAVKTLPPANEAYAVASGLISWPILAVGDVLAGRPIGPIGLAPTRLDPWDLIALPAVTVGWWLAVGAARPDLAVPSAARPWARVAVLGAALFALAATSIAPPRSLTSVGPDVVNVVGGGEAVHRSGTVRPAPLPSPSGGGPRSGSIRIQARPIWPVNAPPVRFVVTVEGVGAAEGPAPVVSISPDRCGDRCDLSVDVAIDWPDGAGRGETSVAWELVVTTDAGPGSYLSFGSPAADVEGGRDRSRGGGEAVVLGSLLVLPLAGIALGRGRVRRRVDAHLAHHPEREPWVAAALVGASLGVASVLAWFVGVIVGSPGIGRVLGVAPSMHGLVAVSLLAGLAWGVVEWFRGRGLALTVAAGLIAVVGLPIAGMLVGSASPTFAIRGLLVGLVFAACLTVIALLAPTRLGEGARTATSLRIAILVSQLAVIAGLLLATPGFQGGLAASAAFLHAGALRWWWTGRGLGLALTTLLIGGGVSLAILLGGPDLAFRRWSPQDSALQYAVLVGCGIALLAVMGLGGHPDTPAEKAEDAAAEARIRELAAASTLRRAPDTTTAQDPAPPPDPEAPAR